MSRASEILRGVAPDRQLYGIDEGDRAGWFTVQVPPNRAMELNRALAQAGIYASGLEPGSDLETLFLEVTATGNQSAVPPANTGSTIAPPLVSGPPAAIDAPPPTERRPQA
jgi:hypothetical protein